MSTDLDLPLLPSAEQIRRREFATVRRGYDPEQVRDYLSQMATQVEAMELELREARLASPVEVPEPEPEQVEDLYEKLATRMADVLQSADLKAEELLSEAKAESGRMVAEARSDADRIRVDAQARAEEARQAGHEFLEKAKEESERVLSNLTSKREELVDHLQQMQTKLLGVAQDLGRAVDEPAPASEPPVTEAAETQSASDPEVSIEGPASAVEEPPEGIDIDPRYEDLWSSTETFELRDLFENDEPD